MECADPLSTENPSDDDRAGVPLLGEPNKHSGGTAGPSALFEYARRPHWRSGGLHEPGIFLAYENATGSPPTNITERFPPYWPTDIVPHLTSFHEAFGKTLSDDAYRSSLERTEIW